MDEKAEFAARLKQAMLDAGYEPRPSVIEREFNQRYWGRSISFQAARQWLLGNAVPQQDKLQILAEWLKIEPQALRFGEVSVQSVRERKKRWEDAITGPEREVMEAFLSLPAEQKKVAREVILALVIASNKT
jgi:transcriptional regulator with XRE-family HTH domain